MKIALINDTHHDCRGGNQTIARHQEKFWKEWFWPQIEARGVERVVHLGDIVDDRRSIDIRSLRNLRRDIIEPAFARSIPIDVILGNHDVYFKNSNKLNISECFNDPHVHWFSDATEVTIDGLKILYVPWINSENFDATYQLVKETNALIAMGHFEFAGFDMYRGAPSHSGYGIEEFSKFESVFSGHYHHKSSRGNIHYLGAQFEMTWSDAGDERGFHVFDTVTRELEYVRTPFTLFQKVLYDDSKKDPATLINGAALDIDTLHDCYVKLIVRSKKNPYLFDVFVNKLEKEVMVADLQIVDDHMNLDLIQESDIVDESKDTFTIIKEFAGQIVDPNNSSVTVDELVGLLGELYHEATTMVENA